MLPSEYDEMREFASQPEKVFDASGVALGFAFLIVLFAVALLAVKSLDYESAHSLPSSPFHHATVSIYDKAN
ncbi:MAG: hypothetical protein JSS83_06235 [Cyanobacteria bacterium SZAS LIN-3]|nr:hypothetical protein [Cyanobacteria bacterium SZAS LIN-3]